MIRALVAIVAGLALLAIVGVAAYHFGATGGVGGGRVVFGPMMRGYEGYGGYAGLGGFWLFGLISMVLLSVGIVWLFLAVFGGRSQSVPSSTTSTSPAPSGEGLDRLREISEMHDRGALNDEEFTAAKRKLLGL
jgi:uncharacterized membrane protein